MKHIELVAFHRSQTGKKSTKEVRSRLEVPCVLYGEQKNIPMAVPMRLFREIVYTSEVYFIQMNIEGKVIPCVLQDIQFHPVSETILHADFLEVDEKKLLKLDIPIKPIGVPKGISQGGRLITRLRKLKIQSLPSKMPESIDIDVSDMHLGHTIKVRDLGVSDYTILNPVSVPLLMVDVPKVMKKALAEGKVEEEEETVSEEESK